jgi:adenylate kinase
MKIVISGTPGTGKTTVAKILSELTELPVIQINHVAKEHGLVHNDEVDIEELEKILKNSEGIIEGHLACEMRLDNRIFILRCEPEVLKKRLSPRNYSEKKLKDNIEAEALDYCTQVAEKHYREVYEIDTTHRTPERVARIILDILSGKSWNEHIDWSEYFMNPE